MNVEINSKNLFMCLPGSHYAVAETWWIGSWYGQWN